MHWDWIALMAKEVATFCSNCHFGTIFLLFGCLMNKSHFVKSLWFAVNYKSNAYEKRLPLTFSSASSGMLGLGWASVASGRLLSAALETAGLINVESLIRPGCKSRTSRANEEILWWLPWSWTGTPLPLLATLPFPPPSPPAPQPPRPPRLMAVPDTLSKRLEEWSLIGLCLDDSERDKQVWTCSGCGWNSLALCCAAKLLYASINKV